MADMTLKDAVKCLAGMRVFVTSRERVKRPEGEALFDDAIRVLDAHIAGMGEPVAWCRTGTIDDDDGRPIGLDETEVHWGSDAPDADWSPLFSAQPASGDWDAVRKAVPTSWIDPMLTGPNAVIGSYPYGNDDIERLLAAVRQRLTAALPENAK